MRGVPLSDTAVSGIATMCCKNRLALFVDEVAQLYAIYTYNDLE